MSEVKSPAAAHAREPDALTRVTLLSVLTIMSGATIAPALPVIQADWVRSGTHICTLGPKEQHRHEFPPELARRAALVVTDSLTQLNGYPGGHVLVGQADRPLGDCVQNGIRRDPHDITLFLSGGLAGTELLLLQVLQEVLNRLS